MKQPKLVNITKFNSMLIKKKLNIIQNKKILTSLKFNMFLISVLVLGALVLYMRYCFKKNKKKE